MYEGGLGTNIALSNISYGGTAQMIMLKPSTFFIRAYLRIHLSGVLPWLSSEADPQIIAVTITVDHRLADGYHVHQFGDCLRTLVAQPDEYL